MMQTQSWQISRPELDEDIYILHTQMHLCCVLQDIDDFLYIWWRIIESTVANTDNEKAFT